MLSRYKDLICGEVKLTLSFASLNRKRMTTNRFLFCGMSSKAEKIKTHFLKIIILGSAYRFNGRYL